MINISISWLRRILFLGGSLLFLFALLHVLLITVWRGNNRVERFLCRTFLVCDDERILKAARQKLEGRNPSDVAAAIEDYQEVVRRDPASAYRWCDLAQAFLISGQVSQARDSISHAIELAPYLSSIAMTAANIYFQLQDTREGLHCARRVLVQTNEFDSSIFDTYDRLGVGMDTLLKEGVPADLRPAQAFFHHILEQGQIADVQATWQWLFAHALTDDKLTGQYIEFLLKTQEYEAALQAWTAQLGKRVGDYPEGNGLFDSDFEAETTGTALDWRIGRVDGVDVERDSTVAKQGGWSLRVRFGGKANLAYNHIAQRAVVRPGPYRFEAWIRTEEITTDQGIGWRIFDAESPSRLNLVFENRVGTAGWTKLEKTFVVPLETRLLEVQLVRRPSLKFDNKISGTVWIDAVSLVAVKD